MKKTVLFLVLLASCHSSGKKNRQEITDNDSPLLWTRRDVDSLDSIERIETLRQKKFDSAKDADGSHFWPTRWDTIVNDGKQIILQSSNGDKAYYYKFKPKKTYKDFPVTDTFNGKIPTKLDFSTCTYGKLFITRTREELERTNKANFAGHYTFVEWGCGSNCQQCSIIDLETGKIYSGPSAGNGYEYYLNSRILVTGPPDSTGYYTNCASCQPGQYLWTGSSFKWLEGSKSW